MLFLILPAGWYQSSRKMRRLLWEVYSIVWNGPRCSGVIAMVSSQLLLRDGKSSPKNTPKEQIRPRLQRHLCVECIGDGRPPHAASRERYWDTGLPVLARPRNAYGYNAVNWKRASRLAGTRVGSALVPVSLVTGFRGEDDDQTLTCTYFPGSGRAASGEGTDEG